MSNLIEQIFMYLGSFGAILFFAGLIFQNVLLLVFGLFIFMPMVFAYLVFKLIPYYGEYLGSPSITDQYEKPKRTGKLLFGETVEGLGQVNDNDRNSSSNSTTQSQNTSTQETPNDTKNKTSTPNDSSHRSGPYEGYEARRKRQKRRRKKRKENRKRWREYNSQKSADEKYDFNDGAESATQTNISSEDKREYRRRLEIDKGFSVSELKTAYRSKIKKVHPDTDTGSEEKFKQIQEAYEELEKLR